MAGFLRKKHKNEQRTLTKPASLPSSPTPSSTPLFARFATTKQEPPRVVSAPMVLAKPSNYRTAAGQQRRERAGSREVQPRPYTNNSRPRGTTPPPPLSLEASPSRPLVEDHDATPLTGEYAHLWSMIVGDAEESGRSEPEPRVSQSPLGPLKPASSSSSDPAVDLALLRPQSTVHPHRDSVGNSRLSDPAPATLTPADSDNSSLAAEQSYENVNATQATAAPSARLYLCSAACEPEPIDINEAYGTRPFSSDSDNINEIASAIAVGNYGLPLGVRRGNKRAGAGPTQSSTSDTMGATINAPNASGVQVQRYKDPTHIAQRMSAQYTPTSPKKSASMRSTIGTTTTNRPGTAPGPGKPLIFAAMASVDQEGGVGVVGMRQGPTRKDSFQPQIRVQPPVQRARTPSPTKPRKSRPSVDYSPSSKLPPASASSPPIPPPKTSPHPPIPLPQAGPIQIDADSTTLGVPLDDDPFAKVEGVKMLLPSTGPSASVEDHSDSGFGSSSRPASRAKSLNVHVSPSRSAAGSGSASSSPMSSSDDMRRAHFTSSADLLAVPPPLVPGAPDGPDHLTPFLSDTKLLGTLLAFLSFWD
ncbi:hypothetical protein C0995_005205, partial [Termitomyces sp. Mi166